MVPARSVYAIYAALLLLAAGVCDGRLRAIVGLPLVIAALVVAARALFASDSAPRRALSPFLWMCLAGTVALGIVSQNTSGPVWFEALRRMFAAAGVLAVGLVSATETVWRRRALAVAVIGASAIGALTPVVVPHPQIDVVSWTSAALEALRAGVHPYTVQAPDVYDGGRDFGFVVRVYPYMPATLLVFAPVHWLLRDFRFALALCLPLTVWIVRRAGRRSHASQGLVDVATLALVLNPVGALVVRSGWNEPVLVLAAAVLTAALLAPSHGVAAVSAMLLVALKQYVLAPAVLLAFGRHRVSWRHWLTAAAVAGATILPFVLWNGPATLDGMLFQMQAPSRPRYSAMSIPGLLASLAWPYPPVWASAAAELAVCAAIVASGRAVDAATILIGSAVALLSAFLLGWQAFVNYYVFVASLLLLASVAAGARRTTT
jgi:hypothetical protein